MRVLVTTQPAYGHFHPLAPLAHALVDAGHEVLVATGASFAARIRSSGLPAVSCGIDWEETDGGLLSAFPELAEHPGTEAGNAYMMRGVYGGKTAQASLPDLEKIIADWRPELIVRGTFEFGGLLAAEATGLPCVTVQVAAHAVFECNREHVRAGLQRSGEVAGIPVDDDLSLLYRNPLISFVPPSFQDPAFPLPEGARTFRAVAVDGYSDTPAPDWLTDMPFAKTVYMTMGTVFTRRADPYRIVLEALAEEELNLVLTVGLARDVGEFGSQPDNVRIERYLPHSSLLPHCDLVVTHGGFNTILSCLSLGIPMVVCPVSADQPDNARRAEELGVSLTIERDELNTERVRSAVLEVLSDPRYRANARRVAEEVAGLPGPEDAVRLLESVVSRAQQSTPER